MILINTKPPNDDFINGLGTREWERSPQLQYLHSNDRGSMCIWVQGEVGRVW